MSLKKKRLHLKELFNSTIYENHKRSVSFENSIIKSSEHSQTIHKHQSKSINKNRNWIESSSYPIYFKKYLMKENSKLVIFLK